MCKYKIYKIKNSTTLRVRKLSPTLLLTKPSVPYLSCSDEKEIFKPGVAVPIVNIGFKYLIFPCKKAMVVEIRPNDHNLNSLHDHSLDRQQRGLISEIWVCLQLKKSVFHILLQITCQNVVNR